MFETIVSRGGLVRKPGEHQRERLLFNFRGWYDPSRDNDRAMIRVTLKNRDLFLFGDDSDAVLEALEADDNVDEYFEEAVTEVS